MTPVGHFSTMQAIWGVNYHGFVTTKFVIILFFFRGSTDFVLPFYCCFLIDNFQVWWVCMTPNEYKEDAEYC